MNQNMNYTDLSNIPIFCLPKRIKDFHCDKNIQKFYSDDQLIQKCIRDTDLLESLCYDHNLNFNAAKVNEFLSSKYDYIEFHVHASRIPNVIYLEHEENVHVERHDIITKGIDYNRKKNQENSKENLETDLQSPKLQNSPRKVENVDTNKYMEVNAEIYPNKKSFCYIIDQKIFFHLRNWHCIITNKAGTYCFICQMYIDSTPENQQNHVEEQKHLENLELTKKRIVAEFGNSIVTEVSSKTYHCGVCTVVFNSINTVRTHCSKENHMIALEYRMNRAQRFLAELDKERLTNINIDMEANNKNQIAIKQNDESNKLNSHSLPKTNKTKKTEQSDCPNDTSSNRFMEVNVEKVRSSYIINGKVALLRRNWHTFAGTKKSLFCVLCNENVRNTQNHMVDSEHEELLKLRSNSILEEFGYSIVMETAEKETYHCGVCNVIIHTLPGMREHCQISGHLNKLQRLMQRAKTFLGEAERNKEKLTNINIDNEVNNKNQIAIKENDESNKLNSHSLPKTNKTKKTEQSDCPNDTSSNRFMEVNVEKVRSSYIINGKVALLRRNWHTFAGTKKSLFCVLCNENVRNTQNHMVDIEHEELLKLRSNSILEEFGYSIVMETAKKGFYHCGVCNVIIHTLPGMREHCQTRGHLGEYERLTKRAERFLVEAERNKEKLTNINIDNEVNNKNQIAIKENDESNKLNSHSLPKTNKTKKTEQSDCPNDTSSNRFMEVNVEKVRSSYIINGKVALLRRNWHTFAGTKKSLFCVLCNENVRNTQNHMVDIEHEELLKLRSNSILEEFGYSIVMETAKKGFYHCGVCNVIIHTLPGMREHCQTRGHLGEYERLTKRAERFLVEDTTAGPESETTTIDMPSMDKPNVNLRSHKSCDLSKKYMNIFSVKRDHSSFLINKKIALVRAYWHGFPRRDGQYYCVLCRKYFFKMESHMKYRFHKRLMNDKVGKILAEFGYGMVSETPIKDLYHCAVCNVEIGGISAVREHSVTDKHLFLIDRNIARAKRIIERVPRIETRSDCVLKRGTFCDDEESDSSVVDDYVYVGVSMRGETSGGTGSASEVL